MAAPLREFTLEAREHLGAFEQALLALENEADPAARGALLARALRAIHSLKGDAGFLGLMAIRDLAHALESLLENSRREAGLPPAVIIETLLAARDQLAHLVEQPQQPPPAAGWDALWRRLNLDHEPGTAGPATPFTPPGPAHPPGGLASGATTGSVPNLLDLRVNLDRVAERGPGSIPQFFRTLSELGSVSQGRLEPLVNTLAEPGTGETTWYRARLWTTLSPAEFPLGWPDLLSHAEIRVCDPREVAVVPLDAACESSGETLPALLTRWSRSGLLAKGRLECESTNFAAGLPAGPVWLQVERPAHMDASTWTRLLPGMDALSAGEVAAPAPNAGRDQGPVPGSPAASHQPGQARGHEPARADAEAPDTPRRGSAGPASPSGTDDGPGTGPTHAASGGSVNPVEAHPVVPTGGVTSGGVTSGGTEVSRTEALRVRVELLDRLVDLVGELTLVRNQALQALDESPGHRALIQRLGGVTSQLQEAVLKTRLQPVGSLFGRFPRLVRDLSRQLGKQVELITEGTTVELDKTVLELLSDPLNHLVRNSLDHGIEAADERLAAGKPATGRLTLAATPADGQVVLEIRDDGRGIDPERVRAKALSLGWKSAAELDRMSTRELLALVLQPGFSTARQVTEISGRGVGLDVVKTNVEQLDGSLTIDSVTGQGTSIRLRVPLTMAILPCLLVTVAGERILIPQRDLEEIACLRADGVHRIETAHRAEMYRLRGELLPVVRAAHLLGLASGPTPLVDPTRGSSHSPDSNSQTAARGTAASETNVATVPVPANPAPLQHLLVVQARGRRFALVVDGVLGTQEVVVKPLHSVLRRLGVYGGAALLGDGRVALIASVEGMARQAGVLESADDTGGQPPAASSPPRDPRDVHRVLLFESGPDERFALPLVQIRRLVLVDPTQFETVQGAEYFTVDGVSTRIVALDSVLNVSPTGRVNPMFLLLPKFVPEPVAILASRIIDTDTLMVDLQPAPPGQPGVLGTALIRERLTLFLHLQHIRERVYGIPAQELPAAAPDRARHILLIDDTAFFREVVRRYLEAEGWQVETASDGTEGLDSLRRGGHDLVICDIEMPGLDGWEVARQARERGCVIPLLALTSLSRAEHEARARACGFDEFEEKLDHDRLIETVRRLLATPGPRRSPGREGPA